MAAQGLQRDQAVLRRLRFALPLLAWLPAAAWADAPVPSPQLPPVVVHAPSPCLACIDWAEHLRQNGFSVTIEEGTTANLAAVKRRLKVPTELESVHTATVAGYFIEGHVPAEDIKELLAEKPKARGLAVPGLPRGAPGRETSNPFCETACTMLDTTTGQRDIRRELFDTLLVKPDGSTRVWARH